MREIDPLPIEALDYIIESDPAQAKGLVGERLARFDRKVVVLDDDPTGVQTVHGIYVYTDWSQETLDEAMAAPEREFFILTNSRGMTEAETERQHKLIAERLLRAAEKTGTDYILVSRSDSTLRGHWPLETETLRKTLEAGSARRFDGEIIIPFFPEGGRYTFGGIHFVREGNLLTPAGMTEFAKDKTFGYTASDLAEWCEEKTQGSVSQDDVIRIFIGDLRTMNLDEIRYRLRQARDFGKVVVDAVDYGDVMVFAAALLDVIAEGREFIVRSAAALTKVLGGIADKPLLTREELLANAGAAGGVVIVGSHVMKTTKQLEQLRKSGADIEFIEFDQHRVLEKDGLREEAARVVALMDEILAGGRSVAVYTRRDRFDLDTDDPERQLMVSVEISDAVTSLVANLKTRPRYIIAKGGITSSDIGTRALGVRRARVLGQALPGIPVWLTGPESKFPGMPYIIFPGNVGGEDALRVVVEELQ